jgi:4-coumarate--CoA ligase
MEFRSPAGGLPYIPDDLTVAQFILDCQHASRPLRKDGSAWLVEDGTGRRIGLEEVGLATCIGNIFVDGIVAQGKSLWNR